MEETPTIVSAKLTPRQKLFIQAYIKTLDGAKSAQIAGYSANGYKQEAYRQLRKPAVRAEVSRLQSAIIAKHALSDDEIKFSIVNEAKNARNSSDRLRALELLGKINGLFDDKRPANVNVFQMLAGSGATSGTLPPLPAELMSPAPMIEPLAPITPPDPSLSTNNSVEDPASPADPGQEPPPPLNHNNKAPQKIATQNEVYNT